MEAEILKIEKAKARKIFPDAPKSIQEILISTFGSDTFKEKITDRIKTYEDALEEVPDCMKNEWEIQSSDNRVVVAMKKLVVIIAALNEGWRPNFNDLNEKKWYPYFALSSGFGFSYSHCDYSYAYTYSGSRLCFKTKELSDYAGNHFISIYKDYII